MMTFMSMMLPHGDSQETKAIGIDMSYITEIAGSKRWGIQNDCLLVHYIDHVGIKLYLNGRCVNTL